MPFDLIVISPFDNYVAGERIADADKIVAILDSEWQLHVVKVPAAPPVPAEDA